MDRFGKISSGLAMVLLMSGTTSVFAQEKKEEAEWTPTAPYVAPIPEFASWKIAFQQLGKKSDVDPGAASRLNLVSIDSIRTKQIKRDILQYSNGLKSQVWYVNNMVIFISPNGDVSFDSSGSEGLKYMVSDFSGVGYPYVGWINANNFQGVEKLEGGRIVARYTDAIDLSAQKRDTGRESNRPDVMTYEDAQRQKVVEPQMIRQDREALIFKDTKLPLAITVGNTRMLFTFRTKPTAMLKIPQAALAEYRRINTQQKVLNQLKSISKAGR